jgi:hypothetical protein
MSDTCAIIPPEAPEYVFKVARDKIRKEPVCDKDVVCLPNTGMTFKELMFYLVFATCTLMVIAGVVFALIAL